MGGYFFMERNWFELLETHGKKIAVILIVVTIIIVAIFGFLSLREEASIIEDSQQEIQKSPLAITPTSTSETVIREEGWMVDVKGEVVNPGTYAVEDNMRLSDVILLAGGLTNNADTSLTNLSKKVTDEMVIVIYSKEEVQEIKDRTVKENPDLLCGPGEILLNGECTITPSTSTEESNNQSTSTGKVNINQASKEDLMGIPGIGEAKATSIIEYRTTTGTFQTIEDIKNVSGIGDAIFESIRDYITV